MAALGSGTNLVLGPRSVGYHDASAEEQIVVTSCCRRRAVDHPATSGMIITRTVIDPVSREAFKVKEVQIIGEGTDETAAGSPTTAGRAASSSAVPQFQRVPTFEVCSYPTEKEAASYVMEKEAPSSPRKTEALSSNHSDTEDREKEVVDLRGRANQLLRELELQVERSKVLQGTLASERSRNESLCRQNMELMQASEERLRGHQRVSNAETTELSSQVDVLLLVKRQLYQRIQEVEAERGILLCEREAALGERACVACLDRLANTVFLQCRHLVCCEACAGRMKDCPVCRRAVTDRMTVFVM